MKVVTGNRLTRMHAKQVAATSVAALLLGIGTAAAGASSPLVTATAPFNQSVKSLVAGKFYEKAKCKQSCRVTTAIYIRPGVAKKLGFLHVGKSLYLIGRKTSKLSGGTTMKRVYVPVSREAKKRLPKVKTELQVLGQVAAAATTEPSRRGSAGWITTLRAS
jgi:hypothetical protein